MVSEKWHKMVEACGAYKHGMYEKFVEKFALMSTIKVFAMHNGRPTGHTNMTDHIAQYYITHRDQKRPLELLVTRTLSKTFMVSMPQTLGS